MADTTGNPNANLQTQGLDNPNAPAPIGVGQTPSPTTPNAPVNIGTPTPASAPSSAPTTGTIDPNDPSIVDALTATGKASDMASRTALASQYGITGYTGTADQNQQLLSKYTSALATAKSSGTPAPQSQGQGSAGVTGITGGPTPPPPPQNPVLTTMQNDPAIKQLMADQQQYLSSQNQQESLTQQYTDLTTKAGIPALDTQLVNMQAVINGTEQDIRNEIQSAGGFATESQVQAMATARNKVLTQNYNQLLQTKTDLETQINAQMGYAEKDQSNASALASEQLNYDNQLASYEQKFTSNAQDALTSMQKTEGWDGIYAAALASGDLSAVQQINQTMGQGFDLATMAKQDAVTRSATNAKTASDQAQAQATLANTKATTANTEATTAKTLQETNDANGVPNPAKANQPGYDATGVKYTVSSAQQELTNEIKNQGLTGTAHLLAPGTYNQMEAWWVSQGLSASDFKAEFGGYIDQTRVKEYN